VFACLVIIHLSINISIGNDPGSIIIIYVVNVSGVVNLSSEVKLFACAGSGWPHSALRYH